MPSEDLTRPPLSYPPPYSYLAKRPWCAEAAINYRAALRIDHGSKGETLTLHDRYREWARVRAGAVDFVDSPHGRRLRHSGLGYNRCQLGCSGADSHSDSPEKVLFTCARTRQRKEVWLAERSRWTAGDTQALSPRQLLEEVLRSDWPEERLILNIHFVSDVVFQRRRGVRTPS